MEVEDFGGVVFGGSETGAAGFVGAAVAPLEATGEGGAA